jgi:hypothetical protein
MLLDWLIVGGMFAALFVSLYLFWIYADSNSRDEE